VDVLFATVEPLPDEADFVLDVVVLDVVLATVLDVVLATDFGAAVAWVVE
jgi:hypothetical protein